MSGKGNENTTLFLRQSEIILSLGLLGILFVILIPMPSPLLDMLLAGNLGITVLLLLITVNVAGPLEISVFPSLLLLMTLIRLSLNVATTRLILLNGDAGRIVSTFGDFVVGGNLIVGLVIFLIIIVIQFVVITKGGSRVSEVAARFVLDALPGKQMAVDAELGAGSIDKDEAKRRRERINQEIDFYGAMDGAGKFVRGDAIAGLIITAINLVGGILLGITNGLTISGAVNRFSILTIGDGLVSQLPALIVSISAGILVTKSTSESNLAGEISTQMLANPRTLMTGSGILLAVGFVPGLPKLPFIALAAGLFFMSRFLQKRHREAAESQSKAEIENATQLTAVEKHLDEFLQTDRAGIEMGIRVSSLANPTGEKSLAKRIENLRSEMSQKYGIWVPTIRFRDSITLDPSAYRIQINGRTVATSELHLDSLLAINTEDKPMDLEGESVVEPAFGLPAKWISNDLKQRAELKGFVVVDSPTVLVTHLGEVIRKFAFELLSREDMQLLLDKVKETAPTVVEEIKPELIRMGDLHQVFLLLLKERVPLVNLSRILEVVVQYAPTLKTPAEIVEKIREHLGRDILDRFRGDQGQINVMVLEPRLEKLLRQSLHEKQLSLNPNNLEKLILELNARWQKSHVEGRELVLLTDSSIRRPLRHAIERSLPDLCVVAYAEIPADISIDIKEVIKTTEFQLEPETLNPDTTNDPAEILSFS